VRKLGGHVIVERSEDVRVPVVFGEVVKVPFEIGAAI
jgi:hypothetical protein